MAELHIAQWQHNGCKITSKRPVLHGIDYQQKKPDGFDFLLNFEL